MGKITEINKKANRQLKKMFEEKGITWCEMCGAHWGLSFAHRHKRLWYRPQLHLLSDFNQVLLLCIQCHNKIEYDKELTKDVFIKFRGEEVLDNPA